MSGSPIDSPPSPEKQFWGKRKGIWGIVVVALLLIAALLWLLWGSSSGMAPKETQPPEAVADMPEVGQPEEASATPTFTPTPTLTPTVTPTPSPTPNLRQGSTVDRNTNQPLDDPAADVLDVQVKCTRQEVRVCATFAQPFPPDDYSHAVLIDLINPSSGAKRSFQWQRHDGQDENGEWVGNKLVINFGGAWQYNMDWAMLCMTFSDREKFFQSLDWQSDGKVEVIIETYHMYTPQSPWAGDTEKVTLFYPASCGP